MARKRTILFLAAMMALIQSPALHAQDFFIHTVTKGQGLYSISRIYGISEDEIIRLNPGAEKVIKTGQELRIPQKKGQQENSFHTVGQGETLYSLSKKYRVSIKEICDINPGLSSETLKTGMILAIPPVTDHDTAEEAVPAPAQDETQASAQTGNGSAYKTRIVVMKRVTIYRICNDFDINEEDFLNANPQYRHTRLQAGDTVNIPYTRKEREAMKQTQIDRNRAESQQLRDAANGRKTVSRPNTVNAVMLLPLSLDDSLSADRPKMTEFTRGMLMAVSKLKDEGISVNLKVLDTGTGDQTVSSIIDRGDLDEADVVFGPKYNGQIEQVAKWSTQHEVPLVLPFNSDDRPVYNNPYVYQLNTPQSYFHQEIYDHFVQQFRNPNIIILDDGDMKRNEMLDGLKRMAKDMNFPVITIPADTAARSMIMESLDPERHNVFIINNPDEGPLITMLPILQIVNRTKDENIRTSLFGYPEYQIYASKRLDEMSECDTWFYSWFFTNNTLRESVKFGLDFIKSFNRQMMVSYPSYAPYGYDSGYYFLRGIAIYGRDFSRHLTDFRTKSVQMEFKFQRISQWGGYINHKVFFVHFSPEYKVEKIDFDK